VFLFYPVRSLGVNLLSAKDGQIPDLPLFCVNQNPSLPVQFPLKEVFFLKKGCQSLLRIRLDMERQRRRIPYSIHRADPHHIPLDTVFNRF